MALTRRLFLERLAGTAGATLTYEAMAAMGLLALPARGAEAFQLQGQAPGVRIVILGGGLAGLAAAYELGKLGYDITVLEARMRAGGRCTTVRKGTVSEEDGPKQVAGFDEGLFYNPGPMRIPHHHEITLGYCRELEVPIEVFVDDNDAAYVYNTKTTTLAGKRLRGREVRADMSGYVSELLAKAVSQPALSQPLTKADRDALIEYLKRSGGLDPANKYSGSSRRGFAAAPGGGDKPGTPSMPLPLHDLLQAKVDGYLQVEYLHQPSMFQVVGGTDRLSSAFAARLANRIVYGAEVMSFTQSDAGVEIVYGQGAESKRIQGDFVICTLPLPILAGLKNADLSPAVKQAAAAIPYAATGKIGLQFRRRFWEEDDGIFGGISRTDQEITNVVYPSTGFLGRKGIVIGYYQTSGALATVMGRRSPEERTGIALSQGEKLHPQYRTEFENAFSVSWQNVPYSRGGWALIGPEPRKTLYPLFLKPDRRVYFAGDHVSYLSGWMQGAFESAQQVATAIHARSSQALPTATGIGA
jgi:monoamine oxidase